MILPSLIGAAVLMLAVSLLAIVVRSPYTHANLSAGFDPRYTRTDQSLVGTPLPFQVSGLGVAAASDPAKHGEQLFVVDGCATCHGLDGRGGVIGPPVIGTTAKKLRTITHQGPKGMPAYSIDTLSDADLAAIAAFLSSGTK
jgi:mono/diheme cytochrome c family protein